MIALFAWCMAERKSSAFAHEYDAKEIKLQNTPLSAPASFQCVGGISGCPVNFRLTPPLVSLLRFRAPRPVTAASQT